MSVSRERLDYPTVDLSDCDREPIRTPGLVQPHGFVVVTDERGTIGHVSENITDYLSLSVGDVLGATIGTLFPEPETSVASTIAKPEVFQLASRRVSPRSDSDLQLTWLHHRIPGRSDAEGLLVHEFEPVLSQHDGVPVEEYLALIHRVTMSVGRADSVVSFCELLAESIREITGFDRVMVYRFHGDHHGEVIAEHRAEEMPPYLGLHYPASDIPQQARELYIENRLRLIADVNATPAALFPPCHAETDRPLDLSKASLRAVSPLHIEYLQNMRAGASMSVSLVDGDRLWGLIACHHRGPKRLPPVLRVTCELLGTVMSAQLASHRQQVELAGAAKIRDVLSNLIESISQTNDPVDELFASLHRFLPMVNASGVSLQLGRRSETAGDVPPTEAMRRITGYFRSNPGAEEIRLIESLAEIDPEFSEFRKTASGVLSVSLSARGADRLLFFRPEFERTVTWAGMPEKFRTTDEHGAVRLSPRKSFESWAESVSGRCRPWLDEELVTVRELRSSLMAFVLDRARILEELNDQLQQVNADLDAFAYAASHDLKAPVRGIFHYLAMMRDELQPDVSERVKERVSKIEMLATRMTGQIDCLMDYAQLGKREFYLERTDIEAALQEALDLLSVQIQERNAVVSVEGSLPPALAEHLPVRLIFLNLIGNALKYTRRDSPQIRISAEKVDADPPVIRYAVGDDGIGISDRHRDRIFELFTRLHPDGKYGGGNGAGLTIVKKFIDRLGGAIDLRSVPDEGTVFYFTLPVAPENPTTE